MFHILMFSKAVPYLYTSSGECCRQARTTTTLAYLPKTRAYQMNSGTDLLKNSTLYKAWRHAQSHVAFCRPFLHTSCPSSFPSTVTVCGVLPVFVSPRVSCVSWFLPVRLYFHTFGFCMSPLFSVWWFGLMLLFSSSCLCTRLQPPTPPASSCFWHRPRHIRFISTLLIRKCNKMYFMFGVNTRGLFSVDIMTDNLMIKINYREMRNLMLFSSDTVPWFLFKSACCLFLAC